MRKMKQSYFVLVLALLVTIAGCKNRADEPTKMIPPTSPPVVETKEVKATVTATVKAAEETPVQPAPVEPAAVSPGDPYALISQDQMFGFMEDLTAIQAYSGWRNSASEGEKEALDYTASKLEEMQFLKGLGIELERQDFHVFLSTEMWESKLELTIDGEQIEVPANGLRCPRDEIVQALRYDSDGVLNDDERNPVVVDGPILIVETRTDIKKAKPDEVAGKVVFIDYSVFDQTIMSVEEAVATVWELVAKEPAALVIVTENSFENGISHGTFLGDGSALQYVAAEPAPPAINVRLEDMESAGIKNWDDLKKIQSARVTWDQDVFSPGESGNLVARIPGVDPSKAVILGAHIDSPDSPGALDDGSGSVILLETARVLDAAQTQPPVDLYLVWFGSEELGLYGSATFCSTHQELLDRTLAMLQIDMLSRPNNGIKGELELVTWSYVRQGDGSLVWPLYLTRAVREVGVKTTPMDDLSLYSDNGSFMGYDVPNADLIFMNKGAMEAQGPIHYAAHIHDPYDTVELAREMGDELEGMAKVALTAALQTGQDAPDLDVPPPPEYRALFVGSHTEPAQMNPSGLIDFGMTLAMQGFDVDMVPYGQDVTKDDLAGTDLVIVLPVMDYPSAEGDIDQYDVAWDAGEIAALQEYVEQGGYMIVTNSAGRIKMGNTVLETNEDWEDMNALVEAFGVTYQEGPISGSSVDVVGQDKVVLGVMQLVTAGDNGVPMDYSQGVLLAESDGQPALVLVDYGGAGGRVLVMADLGILGAGWGNVPNMIFWENLTRVVKSQ